MMYVGGEVLFQRLIGLLGTVGVQNGCCLAHTSPVDDTLQEFLWVAI